MEFVCVCVCVVVAIRLNNHWMLAKLVGAVWRAIGIQQEREAF